MSSKRALLLLVLLCACVCGADASWSRATPEPPLPSPAGDQGVYPLALRYRQQVLKNIEAHPVDRQSVSPADLLPACCVALDHGLDVPAFPRSGVERLYTFMSLLR